MKILHMSDLISQYRHGGSAIVPYELAYEQAKLGHDVTIYASDYQAKDQSPPEGVKMVKFKTVLNLLGGIRITPGMLFADFKKFDIVHLHNYLTFSNLIAAIKSKNCVMQAHGSMIMLEKGKIKPILDAWGNFIVDRCKGMIAGATPELRQYQANLLRNDENTWPKFSMIRPGIKLEHFKKLPERQEGHYHSVLYMGRLHYLKGPDIAVKAVHALGRNDIKLVLAGGDDGYERVTRRLVQTLNANVDMPGNLGMKDKIQALVNADVYVMPSRYEMWGLSFMEALACGTPVIMMNTCAASEILPSFCGRVAKDEADLSRAIKTAIDFREWRVGRDRRIEWVQQFGWGEIALKTIEFYKELLS